MKILHLVLTKHWFDMIASGEKKEEYRAIKAHWCVRLERRLGDGSIGKGRFKEYDIVRFRLGYQKNAPEMDVRFLGISFDFAKPQWSCGLDWCYVISLGDILEKRNVV